MKTISVTSVTVGSATVTLTSNNTNVSDANTVTLGATVYRFKNTMVAINDVKIGASADASLLSLIQAINGTGTPGTDYFTGTTSNTSFTAATSVTSHAFLLTAIVPGLDGNSLAHSTTAGTLSFNTLTGGEALTVAATVADQTFTQPSQQTTIVQYPTGNANWSRAIRISDAGTFSIRSGENPMAMTQDAWGKIAVAVEPGQTWAPIFTTSPAAASCVHASTAAVFTVAVSSELTFTYRWQQSTDGTTFTNLSDAGIYSGTATTTFTITPTVTTQNGYYYRCVATSLAGTTNSTAAILTVT